MTLSRARASTRAAGEAPPGAPSASGSDDDIGAAARGVAARLSVGGGWTHRRRGVREIWWSGGWPVTRCSAPLLF
jgi:hypothetical protein